jgi:protein transport protein SEC61 subunit alpha
VLITIGEAVAYVVSGMYGDVRELGAGNAILIIVQVRRSWFATRAVL